MYREIVRKTCIEVINTMKSGLKRSIVGVITGFLNGLFGSGGGTVVVPAMERFLQTECHKAHATAIAIILPLSVISAIIYMKGGDTDWMIVLYVSIGGAVGGFMGAKLLKKLSAKWLHKIFGLFMIAAAIRMIL